jgi:hypothetical protein
VRRFFVPIAILHETIIPLCNESRKLSRRDPRVCRALLRLRLLTMYSNQSSLPGPCSRGVKK